MYSKPCNCAAHKQRTETRRASRDRSGHEREAGRLGGGGGGGRLWALQAALEILRAVLSGEGGSVGVTLARWAFPGKGQAGVSKFWREKIGAVSYLHSTQ